MPSNVRFHHSTIPTGPFPYNTSVTFIGSVGDFQGNELQGRTVTVWGSTDSGITLEQIGTWTQDGNRDPTYGEYEFTSTPLKRNTVFNFRFAGDSEYYAANSQYFPVRIKAHLSTPIVTPRSVERNAAFTIYGYVRPYTPGHTRLTFYRYNPRAREWMFYKALKVPNAEYNGYTKYTRRYRLPDRGDYYVEARRLGDESNAGTTSSKRYFTVQ